MEDGHTQIQWLAEIQSHVFHHRGQFYNYLKQLQYDVTMAVYTPNVFIKADTDIGICFLFYQY